MRSTTAWLLLLSFHQEPVPSQVTAAASCAHVTLPGTTPRGTPTGESVGSKREERKVVAAAIDRANCRRVIPILIPHHKVYGNPGSFGQKAQELVESLPRQRRLRCGELELPTALYLTAHEEFSFCLVRYTTVGSPLRQTLAGLKSEATRPLPDLTVLENQGSALSCSSDNDINHGSGQVVGPNHQVGEHRPKER